MHEYGHYIDSQAFGPTYLPIIGLFSLFSAAREDKEGTPGGNKRNVHNSYWTETRANRNASGYFGKYYGTIWSSDTFESGRTIIDEYPL